jgi:putative transposase
MMGGTHMTQSERKEMAVSRFEMIAPLMQAGISDAEKRRIRAEIMEKHNISERTLRRYAAAYGKDGFDGLVPSSRPDAGAFKAIPLDIISKAVELKTELPERSVRRIITILEKEGSIKPGAVSRSTLSHNLLKLGCTESELKRDKLTGKTTVRRFVRQGRNTLWQSDLKLGPFITDGKGGKKRTYLASFIDDATRVVCHSEFYDSQRFPILEDCLRKAILKFGKPDAVYVDNGSQYISKWFRIACAKLGIRYMNAKPYSPQSKGKIERFNGTVNEFIQEIYLEKPENISVLNRKYHAWLDEGYHNLPHAGLGGDTPMHAYQKDFKKVRFATPEECYDAFLWEATRKVDNTGCFSLSSIEFEAGVQLIGKKVDVRYDPFDLSVVEIWHSGHNHGKARPVKVGEFCGPVSKEPKPSKDGKSRLLAVYEEDNKKRHKQDMGVLSFAGKEADAHD